MSLVRNQDMFWQRISENCQAEGLKERLGSVVFIIYNYDRCIEHFLYHSIQNYYGLGAGEAATLVNAMEVFHPYGIVGSLPWTDGPAQMEFGAEPTTQDLERLAEQIRTFTEGTNPDASDIGAIRNHVTRADALVFLGFAYHSQNLKLLMRQRDRCNQQERTISCFGTDVGISEVDLEAISLEVEEYFGASLQKNAERDLTCSGLFNTYGRALSFV